jgi:lipopolysaccharide export LptBFGC system permease protein LptF
MDPEFQRVLFRTLAVGGVILAVGATALFFAFRSFGEEGAERRPFTLIIAVAVFILICCLVLLRWSFAVR